MEAYRLADGDDRLACERQLFAAVGKLTRQELADSILQLLDRSSTAASDSPHTGTLRIASAKHCADVCDANAADHGEGGPACALAQAGPHPCVNTPAADLALQQAPQSAAVPSEPAAADDKQLCTADAGPSTAYYEEPGWLERQARKEALFEVIQEAHGRRLYSRTHPPGVQNARGSCCQYIRYFFQVNYRGFIVSLH